MRTRPPARARPRPPRAPPPGRASRRSPRARPRAAGGAGAGKRADVDPWPRGNARRAPRAAVQLRDRVVVRPLLRPKTGAASTKVVDVARDDNLGARRSNSRASSAPSHRRRGRAADRDDHAPHAGIERGTDQLARPDRRRPQRVVGSSHEREAARTGHLDDGGVAAHAPRRVGARAERARDTGRLAVGGRGAQHVQRPLPSVCERQSDSRPAGPLHAERRPRPPPAR